MKTQEGTTQEAIKSVQPTEEDCNGHIRLYEEEQIRIPDFLRRTGERMTEAQINFIIRPRTQWVMPSNRGEIAMSNIAAQDRNLPVEVSIKSSEGTKKEEFDNMEKYEAWFLKDKFKVTGSIADGSMTIISLEAIEGPVVKAKKPSAKVLKKGEEVKTKRAEQEKKDAKLAEKRRKGELSTDKKEEKRAKNFHKKVDAETKKIAKEGKGKTKVIVSDTATVAKMKKGSAKPATKAAEKPATKATAKGSSKPATEPAGTGAVRTGVKVTSGPRKGEEFASLAKFYDTFKLPYDSGFQKLRKLIKSEGKGTFKHEKHGTHELAGFVKEG